MLPELISLYRQTLHLWFANYNTIPEDLTPWGIPNLTRTDIQEHLQSQISLLEMIASEGRPTNIFLKRQIPGLIQTLHTIHSWFQQLPGNGPGMTQNIVNHLEAIKNSLFQYGLYTNGNGDPFLEDKIRKLRSLEESIQIAQTSFDQAITSKNQLDQLLANASRIRQQLDADMGLLGNHREDSKNFLSDMAIARDEVDRWKIDLQKTTGSFNESIGSLHNIRDELLEKRTKLDEAAKHAGEKTHEIEKTLAAANRLGLAKSFTEQRDSLLRPIIFWAFVFIVSIICLSIIGILVIQPTISKYEGSERLTNLLLELPLAGPVIWLSWFSATRYSYTERIRQDYAFKAAVALALEGFKAEAEKTTPELAMELVTNATRIFAQHPLRIYSRKMDDVSPLTHLASSEFPKNILSTAQQGIENLSKNVQSLTESKSSSSP